MKMNKLRTFLWAVLVSLSLASCEVIELGEVEVPEVLSETMQRAFAFEDGTIMLANSNSIFILYGEDDFVTLKTSDYFFSDPGWETAIAYKGDDDEILVAGSQLYLRIGRDEIIALNYLSTPNFPVDKDPTVAFSPNGDVVRAQYWDYFTNSNFEREYRVALHLLKQNGSTYYWDEKRTNMGMLELRLGEITMDFDAEGDLYLGTNPIYRVSDYTADSIAFILYPSPQTGTGFGRSSFYDMHVHNDQMYGFDRAAIDYYTYQEAYSYDLLTSTFDHTSYCSGQGDIEFARVIKKGEGLTYRFVREFEADYESGETLFGRIEVYDHTNRSCVSYDIISGNGISDESSLFLHDAAIGSGLDDIYLVANQGVYKYNLINQSGELFQNTFFQKSDN